MARFRVTVPVTIFCSYDVDAEDADAALDVAPKFAERFRQVIGGGVDPARGCSITAPCNDNADWDNAEVEPK